MEQQKTKKVWPKITGRLLAFFLSFVIISHLVVPAHAYQLVYIQCSIDVATWEILAVAVRDEVGVSSASNETRRVEKSALESMKSNQRTAGGANLALIDGLRSDVENRTKSLADGGNFLAGLVQNIGWFEENNRVLSFPTNQTRRDSSTSTDFNNAMNVVNEIAYDLNQAFSIYCQENSISKKQDASAFLSSMYNFLSNASGSMGSDGTITYGGTEFKWYAEKAPGSGEYVNWFMLVYEAFNNYALDGDEAVTSDNVYSSNQNQLTKALVGFFGNMLDGLRGILGLWSMDELIFNQGWRESGYVGGIFPVSWEPYVWTLFTFMEIFAAMILLYGIINNVVKKAMSTINVIARMHFMAQLQDLLVCAVALALLPIILRVVITLSANFTAIIYNLVPFKDNGEHRTIAESVARYGSGSGSIGGIIAQFMFFGVQISFNFLYAMRALATAILIIIAPVMIAMISVSNARKQATIQWAKELLAQICIQPIHAFCMAVILLFPTSSHGFDNIIALYALLPFTSVLKGFFFGSAGSWAEQASQKASKRMTGTMAAGAIGAAGAVVGGAAIWVNSKMSGGGSSGGQQSNGSGGDGGGSSGDAGGESAPPDNNSLSTPKSAGSSTGKRPLGERLQESASEQKQRAYAMEDKAHDSGWIDDQVRASAANLGAAVTGLAAGAINSPLGQKAAAVAGKASKTLPGRFAVGAARTAGSVAGFVGGEIANTRPVQALRRAPAAIANKVKNSNTAQALSQAKAEGKGLDLELAGNVAKGLGKDSWNTGKAATGTALKAGTGLALGAAGGVLGGMGGRQLMNLGSNMLPGVPSGNTNNSPQNQTDEEPMPNLNMGAASDGQQGDAFDTPNIPDVISNPENFAAEYSQMSEQESLRYNMYEKGIGEQVLNDDGSSEYNLGKDELGEIGVKSLEYDRDTQSTSVQLDFSKMNATDVANAKQMMSLWKSGTTAEKQFMQQSGVKSVSPVVRTVNGERQITGMKMNVDSKAYGKNCGVNFDTRKAAAEQGKSLSIKTTSSEKPQIIPNMSQQMERAAQKAPDSAIAKDVSSLRTAMTGRQSASVQQAPVSTEASPVSSTTAPKPTLEKVPESSIGDAPDAKEFLNLTELTSDSMPDTFDTKLSDKETEHIPTDKELLDDIGHG